MPKLMVPAARGGRVHFGGDALSAGHAWIVGGLNSAVRCVGEVLRAVGRGEEVRGLEGRWGVLVSLRIEKGI